jgi:tetratricopeptide (TPR) repeat protein
MRPAPVIPETAREHYVMAATFMEKAKDNRGYERAIEQYRQVLLAAPWWADAYKKQAITQKAAARYDDAIASLSLYILTQPTDARDAQDEIYKLKALKQSAALDKEESSHPAVSAPKQNSFDDLLRKIDGRRYTQAAGQGVISVLDVKSGVIVRGYIDNGRYHPWTGDAGRVEIKGRETTVPIRDQPTTFKVRSVSMDFIISEDGDRIAARTHFSDGDVREYMHFWQR